MSLPNLSFYEKFALDHHLEKYPQDKTYNEIMTLLVEDHESVVAKGEYPDSAPEIQIERLLNGLKSQFVHRNHLPAPKLDIFGY